MNPFIVFSLVFSTIVIVLTYGAIKLAIFQDNELEEMLDIVHSNDESRAIAFYAERS